MYKFLFYLLLTLVISCLAAHISFHLVLSLLLFGVTISLLISDTEETYNE